MVRHSDYAALTPAQMGRRGGSTTASRLTPERRRALALEASREAAARRKGVVTERQMLARTIEQLRPHDPAAADVLRFFLRLPEPAALAMVQALPVEQQARMWDAMRAACVGGTQ